MNETTLFITDLLAIYYGIDRPVFFSDEDVYLWLKSVLSHTHPQIKKCKTCQSAMPRKIVDGRYLKYVCKNCGYSVYANYRPHASYV